MKKHMQFFAVILIFVVSSLAVADYHFVVNKKAGITVLKESEIKSIFLGRKTMWENGTVILPCYSNPEEGKIAEFFFSIVKKNHSRFIRYWNKRLFSGQGKSPLIVNNNEELLEYVRRNNGAVCLASESLSTLPDNVDLLIIKK
ncbi:MAG: hypothetical protein V3T17_17625 [Pseudomonadales bacterium]